jgi:hypothetical protein
MPWLLLCHLLPLAFQPQVVEALFLEVTPFFLLFSFALLLDLLRKHLRLLPAALASRLYSIRIFVYMGEVPSSKTIAVWRVIWRKNLLLMLMMRYGRGLLHNEVDQRHALICCEPTHDWGSLRIAIRDPLCKLGHLRSIIRAYSSMLPHS